jgi:hypothetical protein
MRQLTIFLHFFGGFLVRPRGSRTGCGPFEGLQGIFVKWRSAQSGANLSPPKFPADREKYREFASSCPRIATPFSPNCTFCQRRFTIASNWNRELTGRYQGNNRLSCHKNRGAPLLLFRKPNSGRSACSGHNFRLARYQSPWLFVACLRQCSRNTRSRFHCAARDGAVSTPIPAEAPVTRGQCQSLELVRAGRL